MIPLDILAEMFDEEAFSLRAGDTPNEKRRRKRARETVLITMARAICPMQKGDDPLACASNALELLRYEVWRRRKRRKK